LCCIYVPPLSLFYCKIFRATPHKDEAVEKITKKW
jgi:hypothetical protein